MTPAVPVILLAPPGRPCLDALVSALADLRGGDPLVAATVLVPGPIPALHVRRALGRLGGVALVDVVPPLRLAERLARPILTAAGSKPVPPGAWEEAARVVLAADPGPFHAVAHHPAAVARVAAALRRLRPATAAERAELAASPGRAGGPVGPVARHLVRLLAEVEAATAGSHDRGSVMATACAALGSGADPGPVVALCPPGTDPAEADLLAALAVTGRLRVIVAVTGEPAADEPVRRLVERLDPAGGWHPPTEAAPVPDHLVLACDAEAEARLVVQHVVAALEDGVASSSIGVVTLGGTVGLGRVGDALDAAGVPWSGPAGRTLAATPSGRAILGLLALPAEGWSYAGFLHALAAAPMRQSPLSPAPIPLGRWAALARRTNVVGGPEQWHDRPAAAAARARRAGNEAGAAELGALAGFVTDVGALLTPPLEQTWTALAGWAVAVMDRLLDPATAERPWPEADAASHLGVRSAVAGVAALDGVVHRSGHRPPTPDDLVEALAERLGATPAPRRGRVGSGVLVATDPTDLLGATPDLLLLAGVVEGAAPARRAADPLVADAELQLVDGAPSRAWRRAASRAAVLQAVGAAARTVAFAHRAEAQTARRPSRWFLGWAAGLAGFTDPLSAHDLEAATAPWLTVVPSFAATATGVVAGSVQERRLATLAGVGAAGLASSDVVRDDLALSRAVQAALARRSDRFTAWDGLVAAGLPLDAEVSASALEDWATCPQRYLFRHVLEVAATDPPADALDVHGVDRGSLAHQVLAAVVRRGLGRPPSDPWDGADRTFVGIELRRRAEALRDLGRLGRGVLADLRIDELQASLLAALDLDDANRAEEGWVPDDVEHVFGERHGRPVAVRLPSGRTVRLHGRIDRVDANADGRVRVVDYKTGRGKKLLDAAAGGAAAARVLQLGVYEAAVRAERPEAEVSSGWWLLEAVDREGRPRPVLPNQLSQEAFTGALEAIGAGIEAGTFPADPGEDGYRGPESCRFCDYDRVCRADRVRSLRRKADDPALEQWRALQAVGQVVADETEDRR